MPLRSGLILSSVLQLSVIQAMERGSREEDSGSTKTTSLSTYKRGLLML